MAAFAAALCASPNPVRAQPCSTASAQIYIDCALPLASTDQDRAEAINDALALMPATHSGLRLLNRPRLVLPNGIWYVADHDSDGIIVDVTGSYELDLNGSSLIDNSSPGGDVIIRLSNGGQWTYLHDGFVAGPVSADSESVGVLIQSNNAIIERVVAREVGTGFFVDTVGPENANGFQMAHCSAFNVKHAGLHVIGGDSNGGTVVGFTVTTAEYGIFDQSFLGNTYIGTLIHTTSQQAVLATNAANYGTYVGTYVELDCCSACTNGIRDSVVGQPLISWVGGGIVPYVREGHGDAFGTRAAHAVFRTQIGTGGSGDYIQVNIPEGASTAAMGVRRLTYPAAAEIERVTFRWDDNLDRMGWSVMTGAGCSGCSPVDSGNSGQTMPFFWRSSQSAELGRPGVDAEYYMQGNAAGTSIDGVGDRLADIEARLAALEGP